MKLLSVVGNRPQFIKSAALSVALREAGIEEVVVHTGQHYDPKLSRVFFAELGLGEPAYQLGLRTADTAAMRPRIVEALETEKPDCVLVYGDTNSTLAGAQAAVVADVTVAHVEAGLRSGDLSMPEELARIAVDRIADLLFCPDERSRATLTRERVAIVDALRASAARSRGWQARLCRKAASDARSRDGGPLQVGRGAEPRAHARPISCSTTQRCKN